MPDKKISQLTSLAQGDIATTTDVLAIVDTSATETKKATPAAIVGAAAAAGLTNVDINSGAIDGTTIGANSAAAGTFTNLTASGTVSFSGATVSNGGSVTTVDINGGTIDGASVGASSASSGAFTTLSASGNVTLSGGTANGVLYLNGSKVATSGSDLNFNGTNVGIGGSGDPFGRFYGRSVGLTSGSSAFLEINAATGSTSGIDFGVNASRTAGITSNTTQTTLSTLTATPLVFEINGSEQARLTSTGLGIGTSSPAQRITVNNTSGATTGGIRVYAADQAYSRISVDNLNGQAWHLVAGNPGASNSGFAIYDNTNSATRLYIDSSGNLGLGVTPSAWGTSGTVLKAIQLGSGSNGGNFVAGGNGFVGSFIGANAYYNGTNWIYASSTGASYYNPSGTGHAWYTAPSGTAGNAISFTQAMTLDASGNLLVGATSGSEAVEVTRSGATSTGLVLNQTGTSGRKYIIASTGTGYGSAGNLIFFDATASAERARITAGGDLLVGTTSTTIASGNAGLVVFASGRTAAQRNVDGTDSVFQAFGNAGAAYIQGDGDLLNTNGSYGTLSDIKLKADIVDAGSQWADMKAVRFRKFKMKNDPSGLMQLGVVAQELEQTSPGLVDEHTDRDAEGNDLGTTTKSVKTSVLLMKAAVALQEAMARIEKLEAEVAALKGA